MTKIETLISLIARSISKRARFTFRAVDSTTVGGYDSFRSNDSSVVQSVERRTVNPYVTGSSPVRGAILDFKKFR